MKVMREVTEMENLLKCLQNAFGWIDTAPQIKSQTPNFLLVQFGINVTYFL